jgi:hypothetical protein
LLAILVFSRIPPLGSAPPTWRRYQSSTDNKTGTFTCFDGSNVIELSQLNDGYPDCDDGSDEPGTPAHPSARFYCPNAGSMPAFVDRWAVGDGVCDCCDGSDELLNRRASCPNTCAAVEGRRAFLIDLIGGIFESGSADRFALTLAGKKIMEDGAEGAKALEPQLRELRLQLTRLNGFAQQARERGFLSYVRDRFFLWRNVTVPEIEARARPANESVPEEWRPPASLADGEPLLIHTPTPTPISDWRKLWTGVWKYTFTVPRRPNAWEPGPEYHIESQNAIAKAEAELRDMIEVYERNLRASQLSEIDISFISLYRQEFRMGPFTMDFFKEIREGNRSLGIYDALRGQRMFFSRGAYCPNVKRATETVIQFTCSTENRLLSLQETRPCQYSGVFATRASCNPDVVAAVKQARIEELEKIAHRLGLDLHYDTPE